MKETADNVRDVLEKDWRNSLTDKMVWNAVSSYDDLPFSNQVGILDVNDSVNVPELFRKIEFRLQGSVHSEYYGVSRFKGLSPYFRQLGSGERIPTYVVECYEDEGGTQYRVVEAA